MSAAMTGSANANVAGQAQAQARPNAAAPSAASAAAGPYRLPIAGQNANGAPLRFSFDGQPYSGRSGDTLAAALLANGVRLVGRSFKYHRPRGVFGAGPEEPNALVQLRTGARCEPNTKATTVELFEALHASSQNRWPSLQFDLMALNQWAAPLLGAGFYYKTFMWPPSWWEKVYEPAIRRAAGLGRLSGLPDPDAYEKAFSFCDVLVIGAGPAGLMAARTAARAGVRVVLCEEDFVLGGRLRGERLTVDGAPAAAWADRVVAELRSRDNVRIMARTSVLGVYDGGTYGALEKVADHVLQPAAGQPRQRFWRIVATRCILAAGASERPLLFANNDRPGVMLASAARTYLHRFGVAIGRRVAVHTNGDEGWRTAHDLAAAGVDVAAVIDTRAVVSAALRAGLPSWCEVFTESRVHTAHGAAGLHGIDVASPGGALRRVEVDALAVSGGWNAAVGLSSHLGARPLWNEALASFVPGANLPAGMAVCGAANGGFTLAEAFAQGTACAREALRALGALGDAATTSAGAASSTLPSDDEAPLTVAEPSALQAHWQATGAPQRAFIDLQHDVTAKDIGIALKDGFVDVEHLKRYTTLGMATDQGRSSAVNGLALMAQHLGQGIAATGSTAWRPPQTPVALGALAGRHRGAAFRPVRKTSTHEIARRCGAQFTEAGLWLRASWYARPGEKGWRDAVDREVAAVRNDVGVSDVSTLGKIELHGADVGRFLDRVYCNLFSTLAVGKARYGLMLRDDGFVLDDGTTARLADDQFVMTTTTANAVKVLQHLQFCHQVHWPRLDVQMSSVTEAWAQFAVAGPRARTVLRGIVDASVDLDDAAFPYMGAAHVTVAGGLSARLFRLSFSGELAYELAVPVDHGARVFEQLVQAGATPYGLEALGILRIEKGHVAGAELNGQTTAGDLGLGKMMSTKKTFIGQAMAQRPALRDAQRPTLVGVRPLDRTQMLAAGAHFIGVGAPADAAHDEGWVSSAAFSPTLGHAIGLGFLAGGAARFGQQVRAVDLLRGTDVLLEVCSPVFFDPEGARVRG